MLIIGLGRFGRQLALTLAELGSEIMVVDINEDEVNSIAAYVDSAQIGDCTDEQVLRALGVDSFDCCFVCMGQDFQSALEITASLKELGAKKVVAKTDNDRHARLLLKIGADEIVYPERDMARRAAVKYSSGSVLEYFELTPEYSIFETEVPESWLGHTIVEMNVRSRYNVNVIAVKRDGSMIPITSGDFIFREGQTLLLAGEKKNLLKLTEAR